LGLLLPILAKIPAEFCCEREREKRKEEIKDLGLGFWLCTVQSNLRPLLRLVFFFTFATS